MYNKTKPRNNQQAFNRVWRYFIIDGHNQCMSESRKEGCAYRGDKRGEGCAVGCMMPNRMANEADKYDASGILTIWDKMPSVGKWFYKVDKDLLDSLQTAHDYNSFNERKLTMLSDVAKRFKLKIPKR